MKRQKTLHSDEGPFDIEAGTGLHHVELWYPEMDNPTGTTVQIGLCHVRAARDIRVHYDFERDGYSITSQDYDPTDESVEPIDVPWTEVAFVPAWSR